MWKINKKGDIWISAALYTAIGVVLVTLILSVGMPFVNKLKARNTVLQTKNVLYEFDSAVRSVYNEGFGSRRPLFVEIGEGDFTIDSTNDKVSWKIISDEKLGIEPDLQKPIEEGNLKISSKSLGQGYEIELFLDYKDEIDVESNLKLLSGKYNLVIEHVYDTKDYVNIRESG
ncbi:hypothetical protein HYV89_00070 [Candidatus Woesearchaeota archaeon]|nr:hypothetical protein [Candidatus Woesearchaeota archaeon]